MIHFQWPWLVLLLPLPYLIYRFSKPAGADMQAALRVPFLADFAMPAAAADKRPAENPLLPWLLPSCLWLLLILAAMRPQWLGDMIDIPVSGRELMLAVDLSASMKQTDFVLRGQRITRLAAIKSVAGRFIQRRVGDQLGLILYGDQAYLQAPLSFDRETIQTLLNEAEVGLAGRSTAIGDAIGLAVKRLRQRDEKNRVLILLTDGANTAGVMPPLEAAAVAARHGLKIYTIGVGADALQIRSLFGLRRVNPAADLDEETLREIARLTGGRYFRARDTAELEDIYALLDALEPVEQDVKRFRPYAALYYWPLGLAFVLALLMSAGRLRSSTIGNSD